MTQRVLLSVHDKTQLDAFARALHELGWQLIASGGTARAIQAAGLPVTTVEQFTRSPEILGGRVKTLHPAIHGGILARGGERDLQELALVGGELIDMVVNNLYPFEQTVARNGVSEAEAVEQIDIGGVALTRAAAKNFERVTVVCDPADYSPVIAELRAHGATTRETRKRLASKAFALTAKYDAAIATFLEGRSMKDDGQLSIVLHASSPLRYGDNPHQQAVLYGYRAGAGPLGGRLLQGKELSYNNLLDLDAAWRAVVSFTEPAVVIVKHLSPCGIASAGSLPEAFTAALASDPVSAYGGVIAVNIALDGATVAAFGDLFVECIAAPGYSDDARALLARRKNCRVLLMPDLALEPDYELRSINRGVLKQTLDHGDPDTAQWKVVSKRAPTDEERRALRFAWKSCQHVKSNAIVLVQETATVGIGGGQPNRVDCVRIAVARAGAKSQGSVMASDAFFPFKDSVELAASAGVTAIISPGGSVRDQESIDAANDAGLAMVFTGVRHFRH